MRETFSNPQKPSTMKASKFIKSSSVMLDQRDGFYDVLMALETNFNLEGKGLLEDNFASVSAT